MLALTFTRLGCPDENGLDVGVIGVAEQDHGPGFDGRSDGFRRQSLVLGQRGQMRGEQALKGCILSVMDTRLLIEFAAKSSPE